MHLFAALPNFLFYLGASLALFLLMTSIYLRITPHAELRLIRAGNVAAALALGGAMIGLALPLASSILHSADLFEMMLWALIGTTAQSLVYLVTAKLMPDLDSGLARDSASHGILLASLSISVGLINAACVS